MTINERETCKIHKMIVIVKIKLYTVYKDKCIKMQNENSHRLLHEYDNISNK